MLGTLGDGTVVYEWSSWENFLISMIFPKARRISARIGQAHDDVFKLLDASIDQFVFHIGLTETSMIPSGRDRLVEQLKSAGIRIINGSLTDISKSKIQEACLACGLPSVKAPYHGDPDELLIVKTNLNYGGEDERQLSAHERRFLRLDNDLAPSFIADSRSYRVLPRREIPQAIWEDERFVEERFISNRESVFYRAYLLERTIVVEAAVNYALIKRMYVGMDRDLFCFHGTRPIQVDDGSNKVGARRLPDGLIESIIHFSDCFGLSFGAVDMVANDRAECFIVDVNSTPFWSRPNSDIIPTLLRTPALQDTA